MWAINIYTTCYLLLLVWTIPGPTAALERQSNQSLALETPNPANDLFAPPLPPKPPRPPGPPKPPGPPDPPSRRIVCFDLSQPGVLRPNVADCALVIEYILRIYPPGPMVPVNFTRSGAAGTIEIPEGWVVKNCQVLISSRKLALDTWDMVRYVDIVLGAQEVLKTCVPKSKFALGGMVYIGDKGSYVTVNGFGSGITGEVSQDGNATALATSTPVNISLLTGVGGLADGDGLDENEKLNVT